MNKYNRSLQIEINELFDSGNFTQAEIGERFGLTRRQVRHIIHLTRKGHIYPDDTSSKPSKEEQYEDVGDKGIYFDEDYVYNKENDVYVTFIPGLPKPVIQRPTWA